MYRSTLIVSKENICSRKIATVVQGEQIAVVDSNIAMWLNKLGHMSEKGIRIHHSKNVLPGLKCININFCESWVYG